LETQRAVKKPGEGIKNRPDLCGRVKMALLKAAEPARAEKTALQPVASAIFRVPKLSLFLEFCLFEHPSLIAKMQHVFQQSARLKFCQPLRGGIRRTRGLRVVTRHGSD